jgi:ribosomal protein L40E
MAKTRFPEAEKRMFHRVFICMKCGARMKGDLPRVKAGKVKCRICKSKRLRPIHKEAKA